MVAEQPRKKRILKPQTVRERVEQAQESSPKPRRVRKTAGQVGGLFKTAHRVGGREYYLPLPDNKLGRFFNKRRYFLPSFFRQSWQELRQVTWPGRKETFKLTLAVFLFAIGLGVVVSLVDFGLETLFRRVLL